MGWVSLGSTDLIEGTTTRGYVYFEYDDASGEPRSCRLRIEPRPGGYSFTVNFNDITVDGVNYGSQANLTQNSGTFWTGSLSGGRNVTASWTNPWYAGTKYPSITGSLPAAATAPSGASLVLGTVTWDSVEMTSTVTSWGSGYTQGTERLEFCVVDPSATQAPLDWMLKARQLKTTVASSAVLTGTSIVKTDNSTAYSGGFPIVGALDFKIVGGGSTSYGHAEEVSAVSYSTPPAPSTLVATGDGGTSDIEYIVEFDGVAANNSTTYDQNELTRTVRYKINDDANWTYVENATQALIADMTSFLITLHPHDTAVVEGWQTYRSKDSEVSTITLVNNNRIVHFYGGVRELDPQTGTWSDPEAKEVIKLYGSVSGARKKIIKVYGSVNGVAKQVYEDV